MKDEGGSESMSVQLESRAFHPSSFCLHPCFLWRSQVGKAPDC